MPVVRHWPGAETTYEREWIHRTPAAMAEAIADLPENVWAAAGSRAREQAVSGFGPGAVRASWLDCSPRTCRQPFPIRSTSCSGPPDRRRGRLSLAW
ncbi:MAG: hypothetical protein LBI49_26275 [Nocardiopsaceae bacterium]|nr:hypothetical protein [Nocardiopsaceae bacterium]